MSFTMHVLKVALDASAPSSISKWGGGEGGGHLHCLIAAKRRRPGSLWKGPLCVGALAQPPPQHGRPHDELPRATPCSNPALAAWPWAHVMHCPTCPGERARVPRARARAACMRRTTTRAPLAHGWLAIPHAGVLMVFLLLLTGFLVAGMKSRWCARLL